jgi:hypothetical protein
MIMLLLRQLMENKSRNINKIVFDKCCDDLRSAQSKQIKRGSCLKNKFIKRDLLKYIK